MRNRWDLVLQLVLPVPGRRSMHVDYDRSTGFGIEMEGRERAHLFVTFDTERFGLRIDI